MGVGVEEADVQVGAEDPVCREPGRDREELDLVVADRTKIGQVVDRDPGEGETHAGGEEGPREPRPGAHTKTIRRGCAWSTQGAVFAQETPPPLSQGEGELGVRLDQAKPRPLTMAQKRG
jgi:hypothetical protein